jgi:hypothetical protein
MAFFSSSVFEEKILMIESVIGQPVVKEMPDETPLGRRQSAPSSVWNPASLEVERTNQISIAKGA